MGVEVPFGEVGPVPLFLGFVEVGVEIDDELLQEIFAELAGFHLLSGVSSLELPVFLLAEISPYLGRHVD